MMNIKMVAAILFIFAGILFSQVQPVPLDLQYTLLLKIITFDKEFSKKYDDKITIGIIYQENFNQSINQKRELQEIIKEKNYLVEGKKVEFKFLNISSGNIYENITRSKAKIIYILPLKDIDIESIKAVTKKERILTFSGISEHIKNGISVGINLKKDKPSIIINIAGAKQEGAEFNSQLLKLSEVVN